jgi:capsular polysaccharide biosynthesis protein
MVSSLKGLQTVAVEFSKKVFIPRKQGAKRIRFKPWKGARRVTGSAVFARRQALGAGDETMMENLPVLMKLATLALAVEWRLSFSPTRP